MGALIPFLVLLIGFTISEGNYYKMLNTLYDPLKPSVMQLYKGFSFNIFKAEETRKYKHVNSGMNVGIYAGECC